MDKNDFMERKVNVNQLKVGMFVARLDRSWLETHFLIQGFSIRSDNEIDELRKSCEYVYIDVNKGVAAECYMDDVQFSSEAEFEPLTKLNLPQKKPPYVIKTSVEVELNTAKQIISNSTKLVHGVIDALRFGKNLNNDDVRQAVKPMVDSIIRNPDALLWLTRLKNENTTIYSHSISCVAMTLAFGRHLNLPKEILSMLGMASLLLDVGMIKVPKELLETTEQLTATEFEEIKKHVAYSIEVVRDIKGIDAAVVDIVSHHHERYDGSGYPRGIKGNKIPIYSRIVAIVDCYIAMTSMRPYRAAFSSYQVMHQLYAWRDILFQHEIVEQFIQCLGAYPIGSLVEMSTGEVGIIIAQNHARSLRPKVMLILDKNKESYDEYYTIDLMTKLEDPKGNRIEIVRGLENNAYGIDPKELYI